MEDDPTAVWVELYRELDVLAQQFAAAESQRSEVTGRDDTGRVAVTLTVAGEVQEIAIDEGWSSVIRPEHLGGRVREAVASATVARQQDWGEALANQETQPAPQPRPMPPLTGSFAHEFDRIVGPVTPDGGRTALAELLSLYEELDRSMDETTEQLQAATAATVVGYDPSGKVRVSITLAGELTDVSYDQRWLRNVRGCTAGSHTVLAFQAAYRQQGQRSIADLIAESPLGELISLSQAPQELAHRLRLPS